jgi:hypothetical protein
MECATCGLTPFDLPDGVEPDYVFVRQDGETYCQADAPTEDTDG